MQPPGSTLYYAKDRESIPEARIRFSKSVETITEPDLDRSPNPTGGASQTETVDASFPRSQRAVSEAGRWQGQTI